MIIIIIVSNMLDVRVTEQCEQYMMVKNKQNFSNLKITGLFLQTIIKDY